jgi:hypothetical protein
MNAEAEKLFADVNAAQARGAYPLSETLALKALALAPDAAPLHAALGVALVKQARFAEAQVALQRALDCDPTLLVVLKLLSQCLMRLERLDEAEAALTRYLREVARIDLDETRFVPEEAYDPAFWDLSLIDLLRGRYERGFARFRARFKVFPKLKRIHLPRPLWRGEPLAGKSILVYDEQGFGDTLMMARFLLTLKQRGARVIAVLYEPLISFFKDWPGIDALYPHDTFVPDPFDFYASTFDLPLALGTTPDTIPFSGAYLPFVTPWPLARGQEGFLKVGVVWAGSPLHPNDSCRSIPLSVFQALFDVPSVRFFDLTRDKREGEATASAQKRLEALLDGVHDFKDLAARVASMDLIITCDTAVAHLAGGMGKKVWVLLPFCPDWRWLLGRDDSPWYASMRLFRQKEPGPWDEVVARVADALRALA